MSLWIVSFKQNGRVFTYQPKHRDAALKTVRRLMQKPRLKLHREEIKLTPENLTQSRKDATGGAETRSGK